MEYECYKCGETYDSEDAGLEVEEGWICDHCLYDENFDVELVDIYG